MNHMFAPQCMGSWADEITTKCTSLRHKSKYIRQITAGLCDILPYSTCTGWCFEPIRKNVCVSVCHLNLDESHESPHTKRILKIPKALTSCDDLGQLVQLQGFPVLTLVTWVATAH